MYGVHTNDICSAYLDCYCVFKGKHSIFDNVFFFIKVIDRQTGERREILFASKKAIPKPPKSSLSPCACVMFCCYLNLFSSLFFHFFPLQLIWPLFQIQPHYFLSFCLLLSLVSSLFSSFGLSSPSPTVLTPSRCSKTEGPYPSILPADLSPFPLSTLLYFLTFLASLDFFFPDSSSDVLFT